MVNMKRWIHTAIDDYGGTTSPSYKEFERNYRSYLRSICRKIGANLHSFSPNHYQFTAVLEKDGKFVYFSISDVRYFSKEWYNNILIRTMAHDKDWRGGTNYYTELDLLEQDLSYMFENGRLNHW